jgi:tetratricopeptide (TPR) repeat protein
MDKSISKKTHCEECGEELSTVSDFLKHINKHKSEESPSEHLAIARLYKNFKRFMENVVLGLVFFLGILLLIVLIFEFRKNQPIVTPFDVPPELKGMTGVAVAELLIDKINNKISSVPTTNYTGVMGAGLDFGYQAPQKPEPVRLKRAGPEGLTIKMEVGGISLDSFVSYVKGIFGRENEVISGDVIKKGDDIKIIARTNKKGPWEEEGKEKDPETILDKLAEQMAFAMASDYLNRIELARFYSNNGKYEEADMVYRKITEANPRNVEAYTEWGRVLSRLVRLRIAKPEEVDEKYEKACKIAWNCGDLGFEECFNSYKQAKTQKNDANVLVEWGIAESIMGQSEAAIEKYRQASEISPDNPKVYAQWGYELALLARTKKASGDNWGGDRDYTDALSKFQGFKGKPDAEFYNYWGTVLAMMGKYDQSVEKRRESLRIDPEYYLAYYDWGLDLYYWGRQYDSEKKFDEGTEKYLESLSKFKQSIYLNPKFADSYYRLGVSLVTLGRNEDAKGEFQKAIRLDPRHPYAYSDLGYVFERLGQYDKAIEKYKEARRINPYYVPTYEGLVKSLEASSKGEGSTPELKKELAEAYYGWGWALDKSGRHDEAIEKYRMAGELGGDSFKYGFGGQSVESPP